MSGQSSVSPVSNPNAQSAHASQAIRQDHSFTTTTAPTTFKKLKGGKTQETILADRKAQSVNQQQATGSQQTTPKQQTEIDNIISRLKSNDTPGAALESLKKFLDRIPDGEITLEQALDIIDCALRPDIEANTKTALLNMLLETAQSNKDTKNQITEFFSCILTDKTSNFTNEIKQQAITALFQNENNVLSEMRDDIFSKYDDNNEMPKSLLDALKDALFVKKEDDVNRNQIKTNENFLKKLQDCKPWAIQIYAHAIENNSNILQNFKINVRSQKHCDNYHLQTLLYGLRNGHEWAKDTVNNDKRLASQVANKIAENLENKATQNKDILLLQSIINSSEEIPEWALKLLVGAANNQEITALGSVQSYDAKPSEWLSEVMRGIKPDAFKKIAEQIVNSNKEQWKKLITADGNATGKPDGNATGKLDGDATGKLNTIATLALATLPKDDSKINESCMPFTALNGLLSISNKKNEINGPNIVASIGKALVDADCNNPTWTNTRTTTFLHALNKVEPIKKQKKSSSEKAKDPKSPSEMAKDALFLCRTKLKNNSYKFDVAIQYVADDESEQKQKKDKNKSSAQNPTPITSFFVDYLSPAAYNKLEPGSIIANIQSFQNYTGEPLYQFKPQTYERIKDAMIMNHARKAYTLKKYQEYKEKQEASSNDDGIELYDQTIPTHSGEVEEKMGNDFNTWYNENKENIAGDFNKWYSKYQKKITTLLNSAPDDIQNKNTKVDIDGIILDRSSFQDQLQYLGRIDKSRYHTLSDEHIQEVTNNILKLAGDSKLKIGSNTFTSKYILEKVCSQLLDYLKSEKNNDQTKAHAKTALETILKYYCYNNKGFANAKETLDDQTNPNRIADATKKFIAALRDQNNSIDDINQEISRAQEVKTKQFERTKTLFEQHRELENVSGDNNDCLFNAINLQKPNNNNDNNYNVDALRQKYVEIQTAKAQQAKKTVDQKSLKDEQADISCLPQMATHLGRPIVVLIKQTKPGQEGTGVQIALPKGNAEAETLLPTISVDILIGNTTIETWLGNYDDHNAEFNALAIALKTKIDDVKTMNVKDALEILLGDSNTIALHFQGDTQNGHYQSFVPKKTGR